MIRCLVSLALIVGTMTAVRPAWGQEDLFISDATLADLGGGDYGVTTELVVFYPYDALMRVTINEFEDTSETTAGEDSAIFEHQGTFGFTQVPGVTIWGEIEEDGDTFLTTDRTIYFPAGKTIAHDSDHSRTATNGTNIFEVVGYENNDPNKELTIKLYAWDLEVGEWDDLDVSVPAPAKTSGIRTLGFNMLMEDEDTYYDAGQMIFGIKVELLDGETVISSYTRNVSKP
jgi:hypothetical protein